jgi:hypothetical protein
MHVFFITISLVLPVTSFVLLAVDVVFRINWSFLKILRPRSCSFTDFTSFHGAQNITVSTGIAGLSKLCWSRGFPGQENHSCDISTQKTHSCGFLIISRSNFCVFCTYLMHVLFYLLIDHINHWILSQHCQRFGSNNYQ